MKTTKQLVHPDRQSLLDLLEEKAAQRRAATPNAVLAHEKRLLRKLETKRALDYIDLLDDAFPRSAYTECDIILQHMPEKTKARPLYTDRLYRYLMKVYTERTGDNGWRPCQAAIVETMACHHPDKDIRLTALEIIVANDIGSGVGDHDIGYDLCKQTNCRFIFTEYYSAQEFEGYLVKDSACPVHGDIFYNDEARYQLMTRWHKLVSEALNKAR